MVLNILTAHVGDMLALCWRYVGGILEHVEVMFGVY